MVERVWRYVHLFQYNTRVKDREKDGGFAITISCSACLGMLMRDKNDVPIQLSLSLRFYLLYCFQVATTEMTPCWRHSIFVNNGASARRTKFRPNVCMNWKDTTPKPGRPLNLGINAEIRVHDKSDLKQCLTDTGARVSHNSMDEAVEQWRKYKRAKDINLNIC